MANLTKPQATLFADIRAAGPEGHRLIDSYPPVMKLVAYGLVTQKDPSRTGHQPFVAVDPKGQLERFINGGIHNDDHKRFLLAWGYIAWNHGMWTLSAEGVRVGDELGIR